VSKKKHPDEMLLRLYAEHGNVWKVAAILDMCGQAVHERLVKLNAINHIRVFSDEEKKILVAEYEKAADAGKLSDLAATMGRTKPFICRQAKLLGLTNQNRKRPYLMEVSRAAFIAWHQVNEHPRGMLGKKHSAEAKENMGAKQRARWDMMTDEERSEFTFKQLKRKHEKLGTLVPNNRGKATWKAGWRVIGGQKKYFRSRWEANYARYLEFLRMEDKIKSWEHEPKTFWFEEIKRGVRSYLPDFRVVDMEGNVTFHEVKGWMDDRSKTTLARMEKFYPEVCIIVVDAKQYKKLEIEMRFLLQDWEI
jgi:hypothetical protein